MKTGLDCGLGCTLALSVTTALPRRHVRQFWRFINEPYVNLYLFTILILEYICHPQSIYNGNCLTAGGSGLVVANSTYLQLNEFSVWQVVNKLLNGEELIAFAVRT